MYQVSIIKRRCFLWLSRAEGADFEKIPWPACEGPVDGFMSVFQAFFGLRRGQGREFPQEIVGGREPFREAGRITLSPTESERRGQDGFERVGWQMVIGLRGALVGRTRQGRSAV